MMSKLIQKHKFTLINIIILIIITNVSCNNKEVKNVPVAHGNAGDIVVVIKNEYWNGIPGDTLRAIFEEDCPAIPMEEPLFDLHQIPPDQFIDQNLYHRNIIFQEINPNAEKAKIIIIKDKYAKKQVFVNVIVRNQNEFINIISKNKDTLIKTFLDADRIRWVEILKTHYNKTISDKLKEKYSIILNIPKNYELFELRDTFAWIGYEYIDNFMDILIYSWPLTDSSSYEADYLIKMRNAVLKDNVPAALPGTYMTTETKYDYPIVEIINHNNLETALMRGLWRVHGDFMGGPFVCFCKKDTARNRMVCAEGFVFYPNQEVRDKIRFLEYSLYTFDLLK